MEFYGRGSLMEGLRYGGLSVKFQLLDKITKICADGKKHINTLTVRDGYLELCGGLRRALEARPKLLGEMFNSVSFFNIYPFDFSEFIICPKYVRAKFARSINIHGGYYDLDDGREKVFDFLYDKKGYSNRHDVYIALTDKDCDFYKKFFEVNVFLDDFLDVYIFQLFEKAKYPDKFFKNIYLWDDKFLKDYLGKSGVFEKKRTDGWTLIATCRQISIFQSDCKEGRTLSRTNGSNRHICIQRRLERIPPPEMKNFIFHPVKVIFSNREEKFFFSSSSVARVFDKKIFRQSDPGTYMYKGGV